MADIVNFLMKIPFVKENPVFIPIIVLLIFPTILSLPVWLTLKKINILKNWEISLYYLCLVLYFLLPTKKGIGNILEPIIIVGFYIITTYIRFILVFFFKSEKIKMIIPVVYMSLNFLFTLFILFYIPYRAK